MLYPSYALALRSHRIRHLRNREVVIGSSVSRSHYSPVRQNFRTRPLIQRWRSKQWTGCVRELSWSPRNASYRRWTSTLAVFSRRSLRLLQLRELEASCEIIAQGRKPVRRQRTGTGVFACKLIVRNVLGKRAIGFEPTTSSLGSWHSTTELRPQVFY